MSTPLKALLLSAILLIAASAFGQITIVNFDFGAVPVGCSDWGFTYQGAVLTCIYPVTQNFDESPGFGWKLGSLEAISGSPSNYGSGVTGPSGAFCPPSFDGLPFTQALLLQSIGSFAWQPVGGFTPGRYTLSFYLGGRCAYSTQRIAAIIDGNVIGTWTVPPGMPFTLETATFTVSTGGTHVVEFMGLNPPDSTAFLSYVVITPNARGVH
jgi:hypothetical protein